VWCVRVYARCRPMARYEIERNCQQVFESYCSYQLQLTRLSFERMQVVRFVDDTSLKVTTARGEKEFEFDAAFSPASTQDQVPHEHGVRPLR